MAQKFKILAVIILWLPFPGLFVPVEIFSEGEVPWYYPWSTIWFMAALCFYYPFNLSLQLVSQYLHDLTAIHVVLLRWGAGAQSLLLTALAFWWIRKRATESSIPIRLMAHRG